MMTTIPLDLGLTPAAPALPGAPPAIAAGGTIPDFARALTDLLTGTAPAALAAAATTGRQATAATGKVVPGTAPLVAAAPVDCTMPDPDALPTDKPAGDAAPAGATDETPELPEPRLEPALAWLLPPPPVTAPRLAPPTVAATLAAPLPGSKPGPVAQAFLSPLGTAPGPVICEMPAEPLSPVADDPAPIPTPTSKTSAAIGRSIGADLPSLPPVEPSAAGAPPPISRREGSPAPLPMPAPVIEAGKAAVVIPPTIRLDRPSVAKAAPFAALDKATPAVASGDAAVFAPGAPVTANTVAPTASAQQAGIDLTRDPGLHRMIDHIAHLRDAAAMENGTRETRIRLIPDALGPVDISVRREGPGEKGGVQVHFTATEAATRQLIADAQPRLIELAEARGLRIERAIVDGGATGDGQSRSQPQHPNQPAPRAPARAGRENAPESTDERIA